MSREIRFRAWDKTKKRFIENNTDLGNRKGYNLGEYALRPNGELVFFEATEGGMDTGVKEDVEISFFTGLLDKNGVEIYEGDVVVAHGKETESTTGEKRMVVDDAFSCYSSLRDSILDGENPEIIGNIYENPELLTHPHA